MKYIYICLMTMTLTSVVAQVGVNTKLPLKPLHIDGAGDNAAVGLPSAIQQKNDVVVDGEGRLGIGTIDPVAKVDVKGDVSVAGAMKVNAMEELISTEVSNVFSNSKGDLGTSLVDLNTSIAYLEVSSGLNTDKELITDFKNGKDINLRFDPNHLVLNVGEIIAIDNGSLKIRESGFYQLSLFLTMNVGTNSNRSSEEMHFNAQLLKSSDNGSTWNTVLSSARPLINVIGTSKSGGLFYPVPVPTVVVELSKNDLVKVIYKRGKDLKGNLAGYDDFVSFFCGGNLDLGFKAYQFSISKL